MNLGHAQCSQITELCWYCLGVGSFSSCLQWVLLIVPRAFWKDLITGHSDILWKIPKTISIFVFLSAPKPKSVLYMCWKQESHCQGYSWTLHLESWCCTSADEISKQLFLDYRQKDNAEFRSGRRFSCQWLTAGYYNVSVSEITNCKTWIWRKYSLVYSEAGYMHAIPFVNQSHISGLKNRKLLIDKQFLLFSPNIYWRFKNEDTNVVFFIMSFILYQSIS